jgi:plastocyanin
MRLFCAGLFAVLVVGPAAPGIDVPGTTAVRGKPIADAVVWLEAGGAAAAPVRPKAVLDQRNLTFSPRVLAVRVGTTISFPNNDRVFHDVFSFRDGKKFELGLYPVGAVKHLPFDRPGLSRVFCNIHPAMAAYIMVVDTPHFAVSDRLGRFTIVEIPAGTYTYRAWRPGGEILTGSTTVREGAALDVMWP